MHSEEQAWKGLKGIRTNDLAIPMQRSYQLSYQANWELVWVRNIPVDGEFEDMR